VDQGKLAPDDLDQRLVGALERMGHLTRTMLSRQAYLESISPLQFQLLQRLGPGNRGPRVSDLAQELDVSQATVSEALSTMRRKNPVESEPDARDRRNSVFRLTEDGENTRARLAQWVEPLEAKLQHFGAPEKGAALHLALSLVAELHRNGVINVARTCLTCRFFDDAAHPDSPQPYHCSLLDTAFADTELRVDCQGHEPLPAS
jgi:DNA-binding MarR family transcriptional regulator